MMRKRCRQVAVGIAGGALLVLGVAMVILPGPAIILIPAGLAVLATEFAWAKRWLAWVRERINLPRLRGRNRQMRPERGGASASL